MAAFVQAVAHYGLRLKRLPRARLGALAIHLADIAGARLDALAIHLADIAGARQSEATRERCELQAALRHDHRRDAAVAPMGSGPFMPAMRPAEAPMADRPAAGAT